MTTIQDIENNEIYKQVLKDSFGGVMYNVANRNKYDAKEIIDMWTGMPAPQRESAGGIMAGAMNFLMGN